jgi:hypothetical protein
MAVGAAAAIAVAVNALGSEEAPASPTTATLDEKARRAKEASPDQSRAEYAALRQAFESANRPGGMLDLTDAQHRTFCWYTLGEYGPEPGNPECRVVFWDVFTREGGYQTRCTYYALLDHYTVPPQGPEKARSVYSECVTAELLDS